MDGWRNQKLTVMIIVITRSHDKQLCNESCSFYNEYKKIYCLFFSWTLHGFKILKMCAHTRCGRMFINKLHTIFFVSNRNGQLKGSHQRWTSLEHFNWSVCVCPCLQLIVHTDDTMMNNALSACSIHFQSGGLHGQWILFSGKGLCPELSHNF